MDMQPTGRSVDTETQPVPLFELGANGELSPFDTEQRQGDRETTALRLGSEAARSVRLVEHEDDTYPATMTVEALSARLLAYREDDTQEDAYSELGGGLRAYREVAQPTVRFQRAIEGYEDWHTPTRDAVERFRLAEMTPHDFQAMLEGDKRHFSTQMYYFLKDMHNIETNIWNADGDVRLSEKLQKRFGRNRSIDDMMRYGKILHTIQQDIEATGIPILVREKLGVSNHPAHAADLRKQRELLRRAEQDRAKYGELTMEYSAGRFRAKHTKRRG